MDHEATNVLEPLRAERRSRADQKDGPDLFIQQLTEHYRDRQDGIEAEPPLEIVERPSALGKPGWFRKG